MVYKCHPFSLILHGFVDHLHPIHCSPPACHSFSQQPISIIIFNSLQPALPLSLTPRLCLARLTCRFCTIYLPRVNLCPFDTPKSIPFSVMRYTASFALALASLSLTGAGQ